MNEILKSPRLRRFAHLFFSALTALQLMTCYAVAWIADWLLEDWLINLNVFPWALTLMAFWQAYEQADVSLELTAERAAREQQDADRDQRALAHSRDILDSQRRIAYLEQNVSALLGAQRDRFNV